MISSIVAVDKSLFQKKATITMTSTSTMMQMKKEELLKDFPPQSSKRYECLQSVLLKALHASQSHFDVDKAMTQVYGADDVATFGKDTLRVFFNSALDKIQNQVMERMDAYSQEQQISQHLLALESLALKLEREATWEQYLEEQDHSSAQQALMQAKLPEGYTAQDVIYFQMYQQLAAQQEALEKELEKLQTNIEDLEQKEQTQVKAFQEQHQNVSQLATEMEKAADVTSGITK